MTRKRTVPAGTPTVWGLREGFLVIITTLQLPQADIEILVLYEIVLFNNLVKKSLVSPRFTLIIRINSSTFCVRSEAFHRSVYYFRP